MADKGSLVVSINQDHAGGDYDNLRGVTLTECMIACLDQPEARAFTYNPSGVNNDGNPVCWLKREVGPISSVNPNQGAVTGYVQ